MTNKEHERYLQIAKWIGFITPIKKSAFTHVSVLLLNLTAGVVVYMSDSAITWWVFPILCITMSFQAIEALTLFDREEGAYLHYSISYVLLVGTLFPWIFGMMIITTVDTFRGCDASSTSWGCRIKHESQCGYKQSKPIGGKYETFSS